MIRRCRFVGWYREFHMEIESASNAAARARACSPVRWLISPARRAGVAVFTRHLCRDHDVTGKRATILGKPRCCPALRQAGPCQARRRRRRRRRSGTRGALWRRSGALGAVRTEYGRDADLPIRHRPHLAGVASRWATSTGAIAWRNNRSESRYRPRRERKGNERIRELIAAVGGTAGGDDDELLSAGFECHGTAMAGAGTSLPTEGARHRCRAPERNVALTKTIRLQ
jgi:hypothetical protein